MFTSYPTAPIGALCVLLLGWPAPIGPCLGALGLILCLWRFFSRRQPLHKPSDDAILAALDVAYVLGPVPILQMLLLVDLLSQDLQRLKPLLGTFLYFLASPVYICLGYSYLLPSSTSGEGLYTHLGTPRHIRAGALLEAPVRCL